MIELPFFQTQSSDFSYSIDLDNVPVDIRITYNVRSSYFRLNIATEKYNLYGLKLIKNFPIINHHKAFIPDILGDFIIKQVNRLDEDLEMTFDNIGSDFKLYYYNKDEFDSWKTDNNLF